jgi:RHS repeat-associated protein
MGGSLARTALPDPMSGATYDAANQLTGWCGGVLAYDDNGNLRGDGAAVYLWDARGQLAEIGGTGNARFRYDGLGRRRGMTLGGVATEFLHDGDSVVQELAGATPTANILNGVGIDEVLARADAAGSRSVLADGLGSALGLVDPSGALATRYAYEPFGRTTATGAPSANPARFTGREDDGTGLYYYRARYYNSALQRFISQDPLGFGGGDTNLHAYVGNDPINLTDPSGEIPPIAAACAAGAVGGVGGYLAGSVLAGRKVTVGGAAAFGAGGCVGGLTLLGAGRLVYGILPQAVAAGGGSDAYRHGSKIRVFDKLPEHGMNPQQYCHDVARVCGINLRGIRLIPDRLPPGQQAVTRRSEGGNIVRIDLTQHKTWMDLANTIAHEVQHARLFRRGLPSPEPPAYASGEALYRWLISKGARTGTGP